MGQPDVAGSVHSLASEAAGFLGWVAGVREPTPRPRESGKRQDGGRPGWWPLPEAETEPDG